MQKGIKCRRVSLLIISLLLSLSSVATPFLSNVSAAVLPGNETTVMSEGISRYVQETDDCIDISCDPNGLQITWIGDSISVGAKNQIELRLPDIDVHAQNSKQFAVGTEENPSGLSIIQELGENLREYVVFALGTNDATSVSSSTIGSVLEIIGEERKLVLVTNYDSTGEKDYKNNNLAMTEASSGNSNIIIADWAKEAAEKNAKMTSDGVHPADNTANQLFVNTIYDVLSKAWTCNSSSCVELSKIRQEMTLGLSSSDRDYIYKTALSEGADPGSPAGVARVQAHYEAFLNRAASKHHRNIQAAISVIPDYYQDFCASKRDCSGNLERYRGILDDIWRDVINGSNLVYGATDNASMHVAAQHPKAHVVCGMGPTDTECKKDDYNIPEWPENGGGNTVELVEYFFINNSTEEFNEIAAKCSSGGTSSSSSPQITISSLGSATIFLDPGHGASLTGTAASGTVGGDGIISGESNNGQEDKDVWEVASRVKTKLEADGYTVVMSREENSSGTLWEKAKMASAANAAIAVSIHTDENSNWIAAQEVGRYRKNQSNDVEMVFKNADTAQKSQLYAQSFKTARDQAEGTSHEVITNMEASFSPERDLESHGNIAIVMLSAQDVPWVYNEIERDSGAGISEDTKEKYAEGIYNGIKNLNLSGNANVCETTVSSGNGSINDTAIELAWPDTTARPLNPKPEYKVALEKVGFSKNSWNCLATGTSCDVFAATVIRYSGVDLDFDCCGVTSTQKPYLDNHPNLYEKVTDNSNSSDWDLNKFKPGDILIDDGRGGWEHAAIYVEKDGQPMIADASLCDRTGNLYPYYDHNYTVYRKK